VYGQDPYYSTIDVSKGLPSNYIYNVFQDSKGFMWFATNDGICRYDGFEFKSYYHPLQTSKAGSLIKEDKYGRIWYENFDGYLYYIENEKLHKLNHKAPQGYIDYALIDDRLLFLHKSGLDVIRLTDFKVVQSEKIDLINLTFSLQIEDKFIVFLNGIKVIDKNGKFEELKFSLPFSQNGLQYRNMAAIIGNKTFLIDNKTNDVDCFSLKSKNVQSKFKLNTEFFIQNLCNAGNKLWLCATKGVICCDTSGAFISPRDGWMKSTNVNCVFQSADKSYWIGTAGQGLLLVRDIETKTYLTNIPITKIDKKENNLVVGTKNEEIFEFNPIKNETNLLIKNKDNHPIDFLKYDSNNEVLYYTSMQFNSLSPNKQFNKSYKMAVKDIDVLDSRYLAIAASGVIGIQEYNSNGETSVYDSLFNATHSSIKKNAMGSVLVGIRGKSIARFEDENAFYCASNLGLFKIDSKGSKEIRWKNEIVYFSKIKANDKQLIAIGTNGYLWTISKQHTFKLIDSTGNIKNMFINDSLLCLYRGARIDFYVLNKNEIKKLEYSYPLSSEQVYDIKLLGKDLYVATTIGLLKINTRELNKKSLAPHFYINSVGIKGSIYSNESHLKFSPFENDVEISYSLLDFKSVEQHKIEYSINGEEWKELANNTRTLRLAALAGGEYIVKFRLDGVLINDSQVHFSIAIPWWKQMWFIVVSFAFTCLLIVVYYRWQTKELQKKNKLLIQKIELEKNLNQSMLTSIKAQMNPHFFYNALNTIQSYIFTDDKKNATNYLSKFSKLTRIILEMSEKESVSLNEEIDALTIYLDLEKVRFNQDFDFKIKVGNKVNIEMIKIPSMIIQPFIENSIKHGLLHKKGEKTLLVEFLMNENKLEVIIDDNGIGRKKAGELNKIKEVKHSSFSTSANTKRLEILNEGKTNKVGLEIIDKYDSNNQPEGTKVIIQIPL